MHIHIPLSIYIYREREIERERERATNHDNNTAQVTAKRSAAFYAKAARELIAGATGM